jgi:tetratricopeptide (TPR) repeat protein
MRSVLAPFGLAVILSACGAGSGARGPSTPAAAAKGPLEPVPVSDQEFGPRVYQVLLGNPAAAEYPNLLAGVVQRQLQRSASRFSAQHPDAGVAALNGALLLMRAGELRTEMIRGGADALRAGSDEVSRTGNEGQALALYGMLASLLPEGPEKKDVLQHVQALIAWHGSSRSSGAMQALGADQRAAVNRSLFEPSVKALDAATQATVAWMRRALSTNVAEMPIRSTFERDEALEAYRAVRAGSAELVAVYLRHGDPGGALRAIERADLMRVMPPGLRERLERVSEDDDPVAWRDLFQTFSSAEQGEETPLSPELARGAIWGSALGYYRSQPENLSAAMAVAQLLSDYGMSEAAPLVLASALKGQPGPRELSVAMTIVLRALLTDEEAGQLAAARRTYQAAAPLFAMAEAKGVAGRVAPSSARLAFVMGALEARSGELKNARPLIQKAATHEPSLETLMLFANIERQRGDAPSALKALERSLAIARKSANAAAEIEVLLGVFEIHRDSANAVAARETLKAALDRALEAQKAATANLEQARTERMLARVLEHYGDAQAARRATERAYEASRSDTRQLAATVLDAGRRALTLGDLAAARAAVQRAIDAALDDDDLIYPTLWLQLLERKLNVQGDGTAEAAYAAVDEAGGWVAKLRAWGRGRIGNEQLIKSARTRVEVTEAKFYTAMAAHVRGNAALSIPKLKEVAASEAIDLVEVAIARDLVAAKLELSLPPNVRVP